MRKLMYSLPAIFYCGAVLVLGMLLGFDGSLKLITWVYMLLLISSAVILCMNKWWGSIPGIAVGAIIIYLFETSRIHHHINETPIGIGIMVYFALMGFLCYKTKKK